MKKSLESPTLIAGVIAAGLTWCLMNLIDRHSKFIESCFDCTQEFGIPFAIYKTGGYCCSAYIEWDGLIANSVVIIVAGTIAGFLLYLIQTRLLPKISRHETDTSGIDHYICFRGIAKAFADVRFSIVFIGNMVFWIVLNITEHTYQMEKVCSDCYRGYGKPFAIFEPESPITPSHFIWAGIIADLAVIFLISVTLGSLVRRFRRTI